MLLVNHFVIVSRDQYWFGKWNFYIKLIVSVNVIINFILFMLIINSDHSIYLIVNNNI